MNTDLTDIEKIASGVPLRRCTTPHSPGSESIGAVGLQQVLMDGVVPQRSGQLDFFPRAVEVDDVDGDGASNVVVAARKDSGGGRLSEKGSLVSWRCDATGWRSLSCITLPC